MRPGPESPSCQRSFQGVTPLAGRDTPFNQLGSPCSREFSPAASPGARGIELDSPPLMRWLPPRALGFQSPAGAGWEQI